MQKSKSDNGSNSATESQTLNPEYQPTLPERMYNRDYAEIEPEPDEAIQPPSPTTRPMYDEVQMMNDQTPRQTAQYVSLEGAHQTYVQAPQQTAQYVSLEGAHQTYDR